MKQIFNWTVGSFFRTIGRTIAVLMLGGLFYYILSTNGFDFGIKDLFFEQVNASTFTTEIIDTGSNSYTTNTSGWTFEYNKIYTRQISPSNGMQYFDIDITWDNSHPTNVEYVSFNITYGQPLVNTNTNSQSNQFAYCTSWTQTSSTYNCNNWSYSTITDADSYTRDSSFYNSNLSPYLYFTDGTFTTGSFQDTDIYFSTKGKTPSKLRFFINWMQTYTTTIKLGVNVYVKYYISTGQQIIEQQQQTNQEIQNQTQQQQQQHNETMNYLQESNTTQAESDAEGFFGNFTTPDVGGLSAIITAPLNTIRSLLNSQCTNLVLPLPFVDEDITLPCMNEIYTQHFGAFFTIYQTIVLALIAYRCIRSIFFDIHGFTNPDDDRIEVMDL